MPKSKGKQLEPGSVTNTQIAPAYTTTLLKRDGTTPMQGDLPMAGYRIVGLPQPTAADEAARLGDLALASWKSYCVVATTSSIALTGTGQVTDGVTITPGMRVLAWRQSDASQNGIYIAAAGAWQRSSDADSAAELRGARIPVEQGTLYGDHEFVVTSDSITLGSSPINIVDIGGSTPAAYPRAQTNLVCNVVTTNYGVACATPIAATPTAGGVVLVRINSVDVYIAGDRTSEGYFSRDNGASAVAVGGVQAGDLFCFNALIAGYPLDATDTVSFYYSTATVS